jgi:hypothetical protein
MRLRLRSRKRKNIARCAGDGGNSLDIGSGLVDGPAPMKQRFVLAAIAVIALSLPGLRASAQTEESTDPSAEPEGTKPAPKAAPLPPAPAPVEVEAASEPPATNPYVPFAPPPGPMRVEVPGASIQFGILAQPQFEVAGAPDADKTTKNIFLRRLRFMVGGTLFKTIEFFVQTDWPNLFKLDPSDTMVFDKNGPGLNIQDAYVTYKPVGELIKVDAGFMLPPVSHNSLESAAKLYGPDYFVNSFRRNVTGIADPFTSSGQSPVGRDAGVQLRVLALNGHIDFRGGAFQGHRVGAVPQSTMTPAVVGGLNAPRATLRLQINLLDAEPGFFYQGTYLGAKKVISIGGFYDFQDKYKYFGGNVFVDLPVGPGILTAQFDGVHWDGGTFLTLGKATVYMGELGYLIGPIMLSPIARIERLVTPLVPMDPSMPNSALIADPSNPSEDRYGGGLAFWPYGHNSNLKAFFTRVHRDPGRHDFNVITVQWQVYVY